MGAAQREILAFPTSRSEGSSYGIGTVARRVYHAAENGYGVAAFNVNNMEQIQSIMEAAQETDSPVIHSSVARCSRLLARCLSAALDVGRDGAVSTNSNGHASRPWQ